jgi:hypothetical protein
MIFSPNTIRNSAFSEPFLKQYRKQKLKLLSLTHWLDEVGDYSGTQRNKYVLESDGTAVINSSHITSQTVTSKKGTATATVSTGQIAVGSGWISEIVLSDGTVYFLEESSGTNFYDSSGAGNNATLTGTGTWAIKRDLTLINNANKYGYTLTGSVIIPVDLSDLANNAEGAALQFVGRVASDMNLIESNCIELSSNGYGQGDFPIIASSNYEITLYINTSSKNLQFILGGRQNGNNGILILIGYADDGLITLLHNTSSDSVATTTVSRYDDGNNYKVVSSWSGTVVKLQVYNENNVLLEELSYNDSGAVSSGAINFKVGSRSFSTPSSFFNGKIFGLEINLDGVKKSFPISEGSGVTSFGFENSSNDINWVGGATWSTQNSFHHNITQGFTLVGAVKLPYKISGAYSNAATNGHNQAETKLKQVVFREDFGASSLHFDQSHLSSETIAYADIANTANVFLDTFTNVKIDLETFSPDGIINSQNRKSNGLRTDRNTISRANE